MDTPIFDSLVTATPGLLCPICSAFEWRGLLGAEDKGADLDVCVDCWQRGLNWPENRAAQVCADCGRFPLWPDRMTLIVGDRAIPLCRDDYEKRVLDA